MRKRVAAVGAVLAILVFAPAVVPFVVPWTGINCRHEDINIKTGQVRRSRCLWFVTLWQRTEDTPLSLALGGDILDVAAIKPWHRVNTFSPGLHYSPHYAFHGALHQAGQMGTVSAACRFSGERRKEVAIAILACWQRVGNYFGADKQIRQLMGEWLDQQDALIGPAPPSGSGE